MSREMTDHESRRLRRVAAEYRKKGYDVSLHPGPGVLPHELQQLHPDLVAILGDDRVVVEVKSRGTLDEELPQLARAAVDVGWRFELVFANPTDGPASEAPGLEPHDILELLAEARDLENDSHAGAAFLVACAAFEGSARWALRSRAAARTESSLRLLKTLYSLGGLNRDNYVWLKKAYAVRSSVTHGYRAEPPSDSVHRISQIVRELLVTQEELSL